MFDYETIQQHQVFFNTLKKYILKAKRNNVGDREIKSQLVNLANYILDEVNA